MSADYLQHAPWCDRDRHTYADDVESEMCVSGFEPVPAVASYARVHLEREDDDQTWVVLDNVFKGFSIRALTFEEACDLRDALATLLGKATDSELAEVLGA